MELKQINEVLQDLSQYTLQKKFKLVEENQPRNYWSEKNEGDTSTRTEIYEVDKDKKVFLKVVRETDSYGHKESVVGISFVTPKEVKVTAFEAI